MDYYENIAYEIRFGKAVITGYKDIEKGARIEIPELIEGRPVIGVAENAFAHCPMGYVDLPNGVTEIGNGAFQSCPGLTGVFLPSTVSALGDYAFAYCPELRLFSLLTDALSYLGKGCFFGCTSLRDLHLFHMDGLTEILEETFAYTDLIRFCVPDSVHTIHFGAFRDCPDLMDLHFGSGLRRIDDSAFENCVLLRELYFPENMVQLGSGVFAGCVSLETISVSGKNPVFHSEGNCLIWDHELILGCKNSKPPQDITSVGDRAFEGQKSLTSISLPDGVKRIGKNSFQSTGLISLRLPHQLSSIGSGAFSDCEMLAQADQFPQSLTLLEKEAFSGCTRLCSVHLQETRIICIEEKAFSGCRKLNEILLPEVLREIQDLAFASCKGLTDIKLPDGLKQIGCGAFLRTGLRSVYLPEGIGSIESQTFAECSNLSLVFFPDSLQEIQCSAFYGCWNIMTLLGKKLKDIRVDDLNFGLKTAFSPSISVLP